MQPSPQAVKNEFEDATEAAQDTEKQDNSTQTCLEDLGEEKCAQDSRNVTKTIKKMTLTRKNYVYVGDEARFKLLDAVKNKKEKIKHAAQKLGINYSSAKSICQVFKKQGRPNRIICKSKGSNFQDFQVNRHLIGQNGTFDKTRVQSTQIILYEKSSILKRGNLITSQRDSFEILKGQPNNLNSLEFKMPSFYLLQPVNLSQLQNQDKQSSISPFLSLGREDAHANASGHNTILLMNTLNQVNPTLPILNNMNLQSNQNFQMVPYQSYHPNLYQINLNSFVPLTALNPPIVHYKLPEQPPVNSQSPPYVTNEKPQNSSVIQTSSVVTIDPQTITGYQQQWPNLCQQNNKQQIFGPATHIIPQINQINNQGILVFQEPR